MLAAISTTASTANPKTSSRLEERNQNPTRSPLLPSERDNGVGSRRPKSREVTSRYLSPSTSSSTSTNSSSSSRRCPSPLVSRPTSSSSANTPLPSTAHSMIKRSQSAERRRPATTRPTTPLPEPRMGYGTEVSAASKILITSTRSLSVSFQGESFSLPVSKTKAVPLPNSSNARKATPERRKTATPLRGKVDGGGCGDQTENSKPVDRHRWPARTRQVNPLTRSLDCTDEKKKLIGSGTVVRAPQQSMFGEGRRASFDGRFHQDSGNAELLKSVQRAVDADSSNGFAVPSDLTASDTESVSSGSTSGETNSRLRRLHDPGSPLATSTGSRAAVVATPKLISSKKSLTESPISSPLRVSTGSGRAPSSPLRSPARPASPSKFMTSSTSSPSRVMPSPSRTRNGAATASSLGNSGNMPSILSFAADVRRGKMGENRLVDAHLLRLLYNRHLQWRFVNARADASLLLQRLTAEKNLFNAWVTTSEQRDSVTVKKINLQLLRQNLKLTSILKGQMTYMEEWALVDRDHFSCLSGAIEALKASILRLPVGGGAKVDIQNVKDAVGSAVDVMQAMASSICSLLSKVEEVNTLAAELANLTAQERVLLDQCRDLLSTLAVLQVKDCSLRTHILQLKGVPSNLTTQV
ncbi:hypothetical protein NE237_023831 [Protea cynaroides]|uniref:QWRF motif-containing protein 2 n=1 Tax=Protea cynaroides TaxID=273540 RepID=A0A9Q0HCI1_9MAGN|nr:hypothetical protein NE237_023831 [Protea cynaroides]